MDFTAKTRQRVLFFLSAVSFLAFSLVGCDSDSNEFVFTNSQQNVQTFNLTVGADPAALARTDILGQIGTDSVQFRITVFDLNNVQVGQQTVARNATAIFPLPVGLYLVRLEGLNGTGGVVGYFDRLVFLNANTQTLVPGLRLGTPPAPDVTGTQNANPYFLFTASPTTVQGGTAFSVTAQVYSGTGAAVTSATNGVSLTASPIGFTANPANQNTNASGVVTFTGLTFPDPSNGNTTITVDATGVDAGTSGTIAVTPRPAFFTTLERISVDDAGNQTAAAGGNVSAFPAISQDGQFVAFSSSAADLVTGDTNGSQDIFVYDRTANTIERVSVDSGGTQANNSSFLPYISADGRYVTFRSTATNLVAGDTNGQQDIFLHDRTNNTTERVNLTTAGGESNGFSEGGSVSSDGRFVAFASRATNLVTGDTNGATDVFVRDRTSNTTERVSLANGSVQATGGNSGLPTISADGRFVAFDSSATNLFAGDTNGTIDILVYDRTSDTIENVSVGAAAALSNGASFAAVISGDANIVAFQSNATNLIAGDTNGQRDVFAHNRTADTTERASATDGGGEPNNFSGNSHLSADGRFVVFESFGDNIVTGDTNGQQDIFVYDRTNMTAARVSVSTTGAEGNGENSRPQISANGRIITFSSRASNLVTGDTNNAEDVFSVENPLFR